LKLVLVGGFLGSGKTTAVIAACRQLAKQHEKAVVITNDQGDQQVDSAFVSSFGIPSYEVINGCFCCNYDQLDAHIESARISQADFIFAESVGSCTDLIATIAKPIAQFKPDLEVVISVFADAALLSSLIEGRASFLEDSVRYIFKKQLEEADILIINKTDLVLKEQLASIEKVIKIDYSAKKILYQNSLNDSSIAEWLSALTSFNNQTIRTSLSLDYDIYGEGEATLAWLDKSITIHTLHSDAAFIAGKIIGNIFDHIQEHHVTIGHLKFFLEAEGWREKISFTTTSTSAHIKKLDCPTNLMKVLINARAQTSPAALEKIINDALTKAERAFGCTIKTEKHSLFTPGYPRPTHRMV
jgi:G3E family GTPase